MKKLLIVLALLISFSAAQAKPVAVERVGKGVSACKSKYSETKYYMCLFEWIRIGYDSYVEHQNTNKVEMKTYGRALATIAVPILNEKKEVPLQDFLESAYHQIHLSLSFDENITKGQMKGFKKTWENFAYNLNCDRQGQSCHVPMYNWDRSVRYVQNNYR